jgi:CheY-like chemotaxis protein
MRVLVLDDMVTRHKWFITALTGNNYHPVFTSDSAIIELEQFKFDTIFLDHDLAEEHYDAWAESQLSNEEHFSKLEKTGYDVAKWMVENGNNKEAQIVIHSCNKVGSKRMMDLLAENGYNVQCVSFPTLQERMIVNAR